MVVLQVTGAAKAEVVARTVKGSEDLVACPAQWIRKASGRSVLVCDAAAASRL
jgi:6-phosphogluconolactonase/glucosamine-6-phosphate isomerase/deaminase